MKIRQLSLLSLISFAILISVLFLIVFYNDGFSDLSVHTNVHPGPAKELMLDDGRFSTAGKLWIIRERKGSFLISSLSRQVQEKTYLSSGSILVGSQIVAIEKDGATSVYLRTEFPSKGWILLTKWTKTPPKVVNWSQLDVVPLTAANMIVPGMSDYNQTCCNKSALSLPLTTLPFTPQQSTNKRKTSALPNEITFQSVSIFDKERVLPSSSYQLRTLLLTGNWDEQWPIGNGLFGGFVNGPLQYEVNPFSISDFFLLAKTNPKKKFLGTFQDARKEFLAGEFEKSEKILSTFQKYHQLGMFQYLFDLTILFSLFPMRSLTTAEDTIQSITLTSHQTKSHSWFHFLERNHLNVLKNQSSTQQHTGRRGRIQRIQQTVQQIVPSIKNRHHHQSTPEFIPFRNILFSESKLDLAAGVAFSSFLHRYQEVEEDEKQFFHDDYHYREWFASEEDNLIVGKYQCKTINQSVPIDSKQDTNVSRHCLNMGFEISREINFEKLILQPIHVETAVKYFASSHATDAFPAKLLEKSEFLERSFILKLQLQSYQDNVVPFTNVLMLLYCDGKEFLYQNSKMNESNLKSKNKKKKKAEVQDSLHLFICNEADSFQIFITVDKMENLGKSPEAMTEITDLQKEQLVNNSHRTLVKSVEKGSELIRKDHVNTFQKKMLKTSLEFFPKLNQKKLVNNGKQQQLGICDNFPDNLYRYHQFGKDCDDESDPSKASEADYQVISSLFQYGRYLLFSSASRSVTNLQGIWSDGLSSAWNGDYHLNINLQMNYWAMMSVGSKEMIYPLLDFLEQLSIQGNFSF
jgi:hypothetical protein